MPHSRLAAAEVLHSLRAPSRSIHHGSFEPGRLGSSRPNIIKPCSDREECEQIRSNWGMIGSGSVSWMGESGFKERGGYFRVILIFPNCSKKYLTLV
jgi:hypothetical protein